MRGRRPAPVRLAALAILAHLIVLAIPWGGGRGKDKRKGYRYECENGHSVIFSKLPRTTKYCSICGKVLKPA